MPTCVDCGIIGVGTVMYCRHCSMKHVRNGYVFCSVCRRAMPAAQAYTHTACGHWHQRGRTCLARVLHYAEMLYYSRWATRAHPPVRHSEAEDDATGHLV